MRIPEAWTDRDGQFRGYVERLQRAECESHTIGEQEILFLRETPRDGWDYYCSAADVVHVLSFVPKEDLEDLEIVAFRQPTHKQFQLCPVWGRWLFWADFQQKTGSAIVLEAQPLRHTRIWPAKLSVFGRRELERLRRDGHQIVESGRSIEIRSTPGAHRQTLLYDTVLHELGHHVEYLEKVTRKIDWDRQWTDETEQLSDELNDEFFRRSTRVTEDFANSYSDKLGAKLRADGLIPFEPR